MTDQQKKDDKKVKVSSFGKMIVCSICKIGGSGGQMIGMEDGKVNKNSGKNTSKTYRHVECPSYRNRL